MRHDDHAAKMFFAVLSPTRARHRQHAAFYTVSTAQVCDKVRDKVSDYNAFLIAPELCVWVRFPSTPVHYSIFIYCVSPFGGGESPRKKRSLDRYRKIELALEQALLTGQVNFTRGLDAALWGK